MNLYSLENIGRGKKVVSPQNSSQLDLNFKTTNQFLRFRIILPRTRCYHRVFITA